MIFVTVGTHEQPFNRLIKKIDELVASKVIKEEVVIQRGYSTYEPKNCEYHDIIPWEKMCELNEKARIIITHGGPASFIDVLRLGKKPIIVPRQKEFNEHVNNHQLLFARKMVEEKMNVIVIENIDDLESAIVNYSNEGTGFKSNNESFNNQLITEVKKLFEPENEKE